jgi:hypothetical protein
MHTDILLLSVKSCNTAPSYFKAASSEIVWKETSRYKFPSIDNSLPGLLYLNISELVILKWIAIMQEQLNMQGVI